MDSRLYEIKLPNHKIFQDLEGNLSDNLSGKLRNLIELKDDVFYAWNPKENCLLCLNLKRLEEIGDETPYQVDITYLNTKLKLDLITRCVCYHI